MFNPLIYNEHNIMDIINIGNDLLSGKTNFLVMTNCIKFVGTIGSTYSGYIHRRINQKNNNKHNWLNMGDYNNIQGKPFSWNAYDTIRNEQKLWWREYPESFLNIGDI